MGVASSTVLPANPPRIAWKIVSGLTPPWLQYQCFRHGSDVQGYIIWLASFVDCRRRYRRKRTTNVPILLRMPWHFRKFPFSRRTMIERVPSMASVAPAHRGASISTPFSAALRATSLAARGAIELMSTMIVPGLAPSRMPLGPSTTSFTWGELGSMVTMTSHFFGHFFR